MRRLSLVLLFLALLALGLFVLFWIDQRTRAPVEEPEEPAPVAPAPSEPGQGIQLGGRFQLTEYDEDTKRAVLRVEADDSRREGDVHVFEGVTLELLDPQESGKVRARLRAGLARPGPLLPSEGLQPRWEPRMQLENVRAEILTGTSLAPLVFETPSAQVDGTDRSARRLTGAQEFSARSAQLVVLGRGFEWELDQERLVILEGGRIELLRPGAGPESPPATLTALAGPLELRRVPDAGEGVVVLESREGAVLEPGAASPGRLEARHVVLSARPGTGPDQPLALETLEADGNVDWTSGEARFQGERLTAAFAREGRLERARLEGTPRAELALKLALDPALVPAGGERAQRVVVLEGQDSIDVTWRDGGYALHLESLPPAPGAEARVPTITTEDFILHSAGTIDGWLSEDQGTARFEAGGGVIAISGETRLETPRFVLEVRPDARGETVLVGTASGGARLEGQLVADPATGRPARTFTLTSPDGLTLERSVRGWRVIEGTRVELALDGPGGFRARAAQLKDFVVPRDAAGALVPEAVSFLARGDVEVEHDQGVMAGEELEVRGLRPVPRFVLRGTPAAKASFRGEIGEASALEIELTGDTLEARGEVSGSAVLGKGAGAGTHVTFAGDELTLDRFEGAELLPGERLRTVRVRVEGRASGTVVADQQTLVLRCARFSGESRTRLRAGAEPVELGALFLAEGAVHADFLDAENDIGIDCERFEVERLAGDVETGFRQLTASGEVRFQGRLGQGDEVDVAGECEVLTLDAEGRGSLAAGPSGRVALLGHVPQQKSPFRLGADHVDFRFAKGESLSLLALRPELRMLGLRARAEHLTVDEELGVVLSGGVRASGATAASVPFTLAADEIVLVGRPVPEGEAGAAREDAPPEEQTDSFAARGAVDFQLSDSLRGRGERLTWRRSNGLLRLEGQPASFELGGSRVETEWVEFDPVLELLVGTGRGRLLTTPLGGESASDWTLEFLSISSLLEPDSVVLVMQEPLLLSRLSRSSLRATWGILWLNRDALEDLERRGALLDELRATLARLRAVPEGAELIDVLALFRSAELSGLLRELYFEGPVEVLAEGDLLARADAIYLDAVSQHGWLARATVNLGRQFVGQRQEKLIIKADWLRVSSDASLKADRATVTSCAYEEPHVRVVTGDLTIQPALVDGETQYHLRLEDNGIEMYDVLRVPLPTIDVATDEDFEPLWPTLGLANSARFGTLLSFAITRPADRVGRVFDRFVQAVFGSSRARKKSAPAAAPLAEGGALDEAPAPPRPRSDLDANWKVDGSYLGSRGGLLDVGLEIESKDRYWFDLYLGVAYDTGEDRGFIRVDEDERDTLRTWLRSQGYFPKGRSAWSFSYTDQSDAAVQSEFYEGRFQRYERSENYLQWRRSHDENFVQGTVKVRLEDFRTDVEELPSFSGYRGRSPLFSIGGHQVLFTGDARAEYLRRRQGTEPHSPFGLPADFGDSDPDLFGHPDGFGERDVLRLDTRQALEMPLVLGHGFKLTPFAFARATGWSEGQDEGDSPARFVAEAGARLGGSFWRRGGRGKMHQLAPFVEYRNELEREDEDGLPVPIDQVERYVTADVVRAGVRTRLGVDERGSTVDLDLAGAYASDRSDGAADGWLPLEVFLRFLVEPFGHQFTIFHEGRFDLEERQTDYSVISVGTHLGQQWGVQLSHQRGRDQDAQPLFEAASVAALYRWTEKWEFEGRQSFSLLENERLDSSLVVRRYAHDLVMDIETKVREGEGSSFGISVRPRFGYDPPRIGYVPW
ncbi:MAG TPA: hypothetical protein VF530_00610 [Planctomycetota bacterium]